MVSVRLNIAKVASYVVAGFVYFGLTGPLAADDDQSLFQSEGFTGSFVESLLANKLILSHLVAVPTENFLAVVTNGQIPMNGCALQPGSASFSVAATDGSPIESGFILDGTGALFSRCDAGTCAKNLDLKPGAVELDLGKTRIQMLRYGKMCETGGDVFYPSWFLDRLRSNGGGNPGVSDRLLVASAENQITIYDLKKKDIFFRISDTSSQAVIRKIGAIAFVQATDEGFTLIGANGFMTIDFVKDILVAGTGSTVFYRLRLGSGAVDQWLEQENEDDGMSQALAVEGNQLMFPRGMLWYSFDLKSGGFLSSFVDTPKGMSALSAAYTATGMAAVLFDGTGFVRQKFDAGKWSGPAEKIALDEGVREDIDSQRRMATAGDDVYGISKNGKNISNLRNGSSFESAGINFDRKIGGHNLFVNVPMDLNKGSLSCALVQAELKHGSVLSKSLDSVPCNSSTSGYGITKGQSVGSLQSATVRIGSKEIRLISRKNP